MGLEDAASSAWKEESGSGKSQHIDGGRCFVNCKLRRNTFLPGEVVHGTVKVAVASKDQVFVDIEQVL